MHDVTIPVPDFPNTTPKSKLVYAISERLYDTRVGTLEIHPMFSDGYLFVALIEGGVIVHVFRVDLVEVDPWTVSALDEDEDCTDHLN